MYMNEFLDLNKHCFTVQSELGTIGHFSNLDLAVRYARDYSFYRGVLEFPHQSRLKVNIFDNSTRIIYEQKFIDVRFAELVSIEESN